MPERLRAGAFSNQEISICGKMFVADMSGALFWPSRNAVIIADLIVGVSRSENSIRGAGSPHCVEDTMARLAGVIDAYGATTVIALGGGVAPTCHRDGIATTDDHHDSEETSGTGPDVVDMSDTARRSLSIIQEHCSWIWVHDGPTVGGNNVPAYTADGLTFRDRPTFGLATHEIAGGTRAAATVSRHGHVITRPCFVGNGLRLILPTFAQIAGGQNILSQTFQPMFGASRLDVWMLGHDGLCPIAPRLLLADT